MTKEVYGPVLEKDYVASGNTGATRAWRAGMPVVADPDYVVFFEDFTDPVLAGESIAIDNTLSTALTSISRWSTVEDSSAVSGRVADSLNGEYQLEGAAVDDEGSSIQTAEHFQLETGKELWFATRLKKEDADLHQMFVGLAKNHATNPEATKAVADRVGFQCFDTNPASIATVTDNSGSETLNLAAGTAVDDTYTELMFHWDGSSVVRFYQDGSLIETHSTNAPAGENLGITIFTLNSSGTASLLTVDYVMVVKER